MKNLARGNLEYRYLRSRVFELLKQNPGEKINPLTRFLARQFLMIKQDDWKNLSVSVDDKKVIAWLRSNSSGIISDNYLEIATEYVTVNVDAVERVAKIADAVSANVLEGKFEEIINSLDKMGPCDKQSLFYIRTIAAAYREDPQYVVKFFRTEFPTSKFIKKWLLHPLVYYFVNLPDQDHLDHYFSYALTDVPEHKNERALVRMLLDDFGSDGEATAFRMYVALMLHPYDARGLLLSHFERRLASGHLSEIETDCLRRIVGSRECLLSRCLLDIVDKRTLKFTDNPSEVALFNAVKTEVGTSDFFIKFFSSSTSTEIDIEPHRDDPAFWFHNMRCSRYPGSYEWEAGVSHVRRFWFTDAGRFLEGCLQSLYIILRRSRTSELIIITRLLAYVGVICPFIYASPAGAALFSRIDAAPRGDGQFSAVFELGEEVEQMAARSDRWWLKAVHWELSRLQAEMRVGEWLSVVRSRIRMAPDYLTGISWEWLDDVFTKLCIKPFKGNFNGIYVLLLRMVEMRKHESNRLRNAVDSIARQSKSFKDFLHLIGSEYMDGEFVSAFVAYFLSPNTIMLLRFTDNYTEASSLRIQALEWCAHKFGFNSLLTKEQLAQEVRAFETELMLLNVSANQFEITWDIFKKDVKLKLDDHYRAFAAFAQKQDNSLTDMKVALGFPFVNGAAIHYEMRNNDKLAANIYCLIIDSFLEHPSQGIESILSIRIRHINFKRQFTDLMTSFRSDGSWQVAEVRRARLLDRFEGAVHDCVQQWIDKYVHQLRPEKPDGLFDFIPSEADLLAMVKGAKDASFEAMIDSAVTWLREKLEAVLEKARDKLSNDLKRDLTARIRSEADALADSYPNHMKAIRDTAGMLTGNLHKLVDQLNDWFQTSNYAPEVPATPEQMLMVLRARYRSDIDQGRLRLAMAPLTLGLTIEKGNVRLMFDLCCEVINNALKYGVKPKVLILITAYQDHEYSGLRFSSLCPLGEREVSAVDGDPLLPRSALFIEGNSGLPKVAGLAASIAGRQLKITATRRLRSYHVDVPLFPAQHATLATMMSAG